MNWYNLTDEAIEKFNRLGYVLAEIHSGTFTFELKSNSDVEIVLETYFDEPRFWKHTSYFFNFEDYGDRHLNFTAEELEVVYEIYKAMFMEAIKLREPLNMPLNENTELHLYFEFKAKVKWNGNHYSSGEDVIGSSIDLDKNKYWLYDDHEEYISGLGDVTRHEWVEVDPDTIEIIKVEGEF